MALTASTVRATAADYREHEPLYPVEQEQLETLPAALESGTYGWRDLEWIVRWYYRRSLGDVAHTERRAAEAAFRRNDFESVQAALEAVIATEPANVGARLERLTALKGVDVPVASAFLFVLEPERYIVVGEREWQALVAAGELAGDYPNPPTPADYERYLACCRDLCQRLECEMWTLYRALWRLRGA
ncbi:hypothetical protein [Natronolimnobius baerhuensis]|uniref:Uncharacterized protein n=1 Tax=Natronolimnobius baerhuensis TaxID=253108 RepID=A0A202E5S1_9EURY|nr:hypothetical protein [Natronolimnobius baerhuensis]OVE83250.1 hypothetical protein B2G88_17785 [Natronolimnobius baerhuensis]